MCSHKLRIAISSSNYPRFSANPNNGLPITVNGTALIAQNTVFHNAQYPSSITLPVVTYVRSPCMRACSSSSSSSRVLTFVRAACCSMEQLPEVVIKTEDDERDARVAHIFDV